MKKAEFEKYYAGIAAKVEGLREIEGFSNDDVRCWLIGYVTTGEHSYTSAQLRKVFDLGFGDGKAPGAGKQSGT